MTRGRLIRRGGTGMRASFHSVQVTSAPTTNQTAQRAGTSTLSFGVTARGRAIGAAQWQLQDFQGNALTGWQNLSFTGATANVSGFTCPNTADDTRTVIAFRVSANETAPLPTKTNAGFTQVLPAIPASKIGINEGDFIYYGNTTVTQDLFFSGGTNVRRGDFVTVGGTQYPTTEDGAGGSFRITWDGFVFREVPSGFNRHNFSLPYNIPDSLAGTYDFYARDQSGNLVTGLNINGYGGLAITLDSAGGTRTGYFTITTGWGTPNAGIGVTASSIPLGTGIKISCKRQGEPVRTINPVVGTNRAKIAQFLRFMSSRAINSYGFYAERTSTLQPLFTSTRRLRGNGVIDIETAVAMCNAANVDLWWCFHHLSDDSLIAYEAQYAANNLNPGLTMIGEFCNEIWNFGFFQQRDCQLLGLKRGYGPPGATRANAVPIPTIYDAFSVTFGGPNNPKLVSDTGVTLVNFNSGDYIYGQNNTGQIGLYRANTNTTAGDNISTSGKFDVIVSPSDVSKVGYRFQAARTGEIKLAMQAAFAGRSRAPITVLGAQSAGPMSLITNMLEWDNSKWICDRVAIASYWQPDGNRGSYSDESYGWTVAEKDLLYTSGIPAALDGFFASTDAMVDASVAQARQKRVQMAEWCAANGLNKDAIGVNQYECNWHHQFQGWPDQATNYNASTAYGINTFCIGSDGKTYRSKANGNIGNAPPNATFWDEYWDAATTTTRQAANPRLILQFFNAIKNDQRFGAANLRLFQGLQQWQGDEISFFDAVGRVNYPGNADVPAGVGNIYGWSSMKNEDDFQTDGLAGTNWIAKAMKDFKDSL